MLQPREDGLFLVRESTNFPGDYTLCVCFQGKVEHYRVKYLENKLTIDDEEYFENLGQLVDVSFAFLCVTIFPFLNFNVILTNLLNCPLNSTMKKTLTVCVRS